MNQNDFTDLSGVTEKQFPDGIFLPHRLNDEMVSVMMEITEHLDHYDQLKKDVIYADHGDVVDGAYYSQGEIELWHASIGMLTEAIELNQAIWAWIIGQEQLDVVNVAEEIGDSRFYEAMFLRKLGLSPSVIMENNINKLKSRYPGGFSDHAALNRDIDTERKILEDDSE